MRTLVSLWLLVACLCVGVHAQAFCGFFVAGGDAKLFNDATLTVLMREGTRTVLSMQNNYQGPPEDFAMVVPVPVVLQEDDVRTLERDVFDRVDALSAPRLVEYWEQDPCAPEPNWEAMPAPTAAMAVEESAVEDDAEYQVVVEARFTVGEYEVVILSAGESTGLERWLKANGYRIPNGAAAVLAPYIQQGMKFFVARVDVEKVKFEGGRAKLSPLRFHYDTPGFSLPIRLGLLNAQGKQDLITIILARNQRYEVANYDNVTIPTNLEVSNSTREHFGEFYVTLFDNVMEAHPRAVITEYSWNAGNCDPCPGPALTAEDLVTLGLDALPEGGTAVDPWQVTAEFVLTRLHARYDAQEASEDLVFRRAVPITGGREHDGRSVATTEQGYNNFQARYIIRHEWTGPVECDNPKRGVWGGPPQGQEPPPVAARDTAFAPRGSASLSNFVEGSLSDLQVLKTQGKPAGPPPKITPQAGGCSSCRVGRRTPPSEVLGLLGATLLALGLVSARSLARPKRRS